VLGQAPEGEALVDLVLAITRLPQGTVPALRATVARDLGFEPSTERRHEVDKIEAECRARVEALAARGWALTSRVREADRDAISPADLVVPATRSAGEIPNQEPQVRSK
jgi:cobaltochelatase CobN